MQKPGTPVRPYLKLFETLLKEVPADQSELVRDLLSGLDDENMAQRIAAKQHETIREAVADILKHVTRKDFLRRRRHEKVAAVAPVGEEMVKGAVAELTQTIWAMQKENNEKFAKVMAISTSAKATPPEKIPTRAPRRAGREDKCHRCQKFVHFARDCRTNLSPINVIPQRTPQYLDKIRKGKGKGRWYEVF